MVWTYVVKKLLGKSEVRWLVQKGYLVLLNPSISCARGFRCLGVPCLGQDAAWGKEQHLFSIPPAPFLLRPGQMALSEESCDLLT